MSPNVSLILSRGMLCIPMFSLMCATQMLCKIHAVVRKQCLGVLKSDVKQISQKRKEKKEKKANLRRLLLTSSLRPFPGSQLFQLGIDPKFISIYKCLAHTMFLAFKNRFFSSIHLSNYFRRFSLFGTPDMILSLQVN